MRIMSELEQHGGNSPFSQPVAGDVADAAPSRPAGLDDAFWDEANGLKVDELIRAHGELATFKSDYDARAAEVPDSADAYQVQLPDGLEADSADPMWLASKEFAKTHGLDQDGYDALIAMYVQIETNKAAVVDKAQELLAASLGSNGASRIADLGNFFVSTFGQSVGDQLKATLFSPDIVVAMERLKAGFTSQAQAAPGNTAQPARPQPRTDGRPENWDRMTARDQRTWQLEQSMRRHA
jgi:hypothetical protein